MLSKYEHVAQPVDIIIWKYIDEEHPGWSTAITRRISLLWNEDDRKALIALYEMPCSKCNNQMGFHIFDGINYQCK